MSFRKGIGIKKNIEMSSTFQTLPPKAVKCLHKAGLLACSIVFGLPIPKCLEQWLR